MVYNIDKIVRTKMFGHVFQEKGGWHDWFRPADNIVIYCTSGSIKMEVEDKRYHLSKGDLLLISAKSRYRPLEGEACSYYFSHFEASLSYENIEPSNAIVISPHTGLRDGYAYTCISNYDTLVEVPSYIKDVPYYIADIFKKAEILKPNKNYHDQLLLDNLIRELLINMGNIVDMRYDKHLLIMMDYIEKHYADKLSLSILSEKFSLSESYIARLFKKYLFIKPSEYINNIRISVALSLLLETNLLVSEIAEKSGFSDVYYFSKVFKKNIGVSPLKVRTRK